jgi:uncharacterized protein (DUF2252 family)
METVSVEDRVERGRDARQRTPRSSQGEWSPAADRPDPIAIIERQNEGRVPFLVPVRHARMGVNAFTFYRGTAAVMAADLAGTPDGGLMVQLGGDAHLSNFGAYASPERNLIFDANDFDETLAGPWEWDLKRLATSFMIAGRHLGFGKTGCRKATDRVTRSYREAMAEYASMGFLDLWNRVLRVDELQATAGVAPKEFAERIARFEARAKRKTSLQAVGKLTEVVDGRLRIRSQPPVLFPLSGLPPEYHPDELEAAARQAVHTYKSTLDEARRRLADRYSIVDVGFKVVGVGSVGTRCLIILLRGRDEDDLLFLQAKEAGPSVLEAYLGESPYPNSGQRVVEGQRLVQAQSDIFLGWTEGTSADYHFYLRQLRDWKGSVEIEGGTPNQLRLYAQLCGRTLARGHARAGDPVAINAYMGSSDRLDEAITAFAEVYADQNEQDFEAFRAAVDSGRLEVAPTEPG